ncbi:hypothetical protein B0H17DRAFT_1207952 [Mycena rosella]|uniref:Uncharacterized protein n=1 Tax=Mycena rosella TaxID=1033263 RepID=A0AAD7D5J9_MYCRO|nr:hypothetical protein B0H17DRAFT_1207952 [Mycena rosella]
MNHQILRAVAATAQRLPSSTTFISQRHLVLPQGVQEPTDQKQLQALEDLASAAHSAADSVLCSRLVSASPVYLADDFADVSVWLGQGSYGKGNEHAVLKKLGLESLAKGGRISSVELSAKGIPVTVNLNTDNPNTDEMDAFSAELAKLQDVHCFFMHPASGSDVIYSLVGKFKNASGWGGLLNIGIQSDD